MITAAELTAIEDDEIAALVAEQRAAGLEVATDGEFRRGWWHFDFFGMLNGVEIVEQEHGIQFTGVETKPHGIRVTGPISFPADHPMLEHFRKLALAVASSETAATPKMTIPAPSVLHFRLGRDAVDPAVYTSRDALFDDLAAAYRAAIAAFYDAGCRYLQFDDTAWAYLCSRDELAGARERGTDTDGLAEAYAALINASLAGRPGDLTITTHVCRGNFRSTWISSGGYEPIAEQLLAVCDYDGYFLEYDSDRAGGFEPLRFLPVGDKVVVLGLVTTKTGALEDPSDIQRRIDEAAEFAPRDQLALSPQCGFASTEDGNDLTVDEQWAKIREVVSVAAAAWV
ncbi:5-methyltetrahydropteroyltriglutamate--homocysteine S-methyltransferase [Frondihabitans sucicola]|uniref:5-methyltetrahydropteroyltriglutamate--homocysteine S-methyltransferase n=1 Tax=Frondihabitans sucicola TaxID=1268041 RepID=A0ABN6XU79_9MICO|nr:5-methyltetrahydropteroyltriglutamate--homocysteine S-methyltransferase [Frondihabitans sucicola]